MSKYTSEKKRLEEYKSEFTKWLNELNPYHKKFDENYKKYIGYNETVGTGSKIADPVAAELTERVVQKLFERDPKFFVVSKGMDIPEAVKDVMASMVDFCWNNQDVVQSTGSMRSKLKVGGREFVILGNVAFEVFWNAEANAPDFRVVPIEDVIFDPTKNLKTSPVYYIRQFVSIDYLKENVEIKKNGEVVTGIFDSAAIKKLEKLYPEKTLRKDPTDVTVKRYNSDEDVNVDQIQLITRWEGKKCCRFVMGDDEESPIIIQEFENEVLGTNPLQFAIDKEVVKEPYGTSIVDDLSGLLKAKNMFLNQEMDYRSKVLNPPMFVDPIVAQNPISTKTLSNAYKLGGIVIANPSQVDHKQIPNIGNAGLDILNWIEGRAESVTGINGWVSGAADPSTNGQGQKTAAEVNARQAAGVSPVADRQANLEESIIEPIVNKWIKMLGATMGNDEFKWVVISGEDQKKVKLTKGFITGKIKVVDLMEAGVLEDDNEIQALVDTMMYEGKDPETDTVFDVDWLIRVETGSLAEKNEAQELEKKQAAIQMGLQMGLPIDVEKMWKEVMMQAGYKEPEQYLKQMEEMYGGPIDPATGQPMGGALPNGEIPQQQPGLPPMAAGPGVPGAI